MGRYSDREFDDVDGYDGYDGYDEYDGYGAVRRRRTARYAPSSVALTVIGMLATAIATAMVIKTGGSASTADADAATAAPAKRTVVATAGPVAAPGPEVPVRVAATAQAAEPQAQPQIDAREFVYTVAGNQRPDDPVTIVYADETGALRTAENVTLPWTLTVTPALPVTYVTANSTGSQLNCWITDARGATVVSQTQFSPSTTCNH